MWGYTRTKSTLLSVLQPIRIRQNKLAWDKHTYIWAIYEPEYKYNNFKGDTMKRTQKLIIVATLLIVIALLTLVACDTDKSANKKLNEGVNNAMNSGANIVANQPAPTDLDYSLERYNVIRRAYWVNGQREKAMTLPCSVTRPLGYIVLFSKSGAVVGRFVVDGKVSSLNSYLFPAEWLQRVEHNGDWHYEIVEIAGIDGCYGSNVSGIFFFTTDGKYIEWTGDFLYSEIPFTVDEPILKTEG